MPKQFTVEIRISKRIILFHVHTMLEVSKLVRAFPNSATVYFFGTQDLVSPKFYNRLAVLASAA